MASTITLSPAVEISINERKATYEAAHTAFKRHEAWGWHLVKDFMVGLSDEDPMQAQEKATIQEGVDTYHKLHAELKRAKKAYKKALKKASVATTAQVMEPDIIEVTHEEVEEYMENRFPTVIPMVPSEPVPSEVIGEVAVEEPYPIWRAFPTYEPEPVPEPQPEPKPINYTQLVQQQWQAEHNTFYRALRKFRRFTLSCGKATFATDSRQGSVCSAYATFQVAKDGACYEDMSLDMEELTVAGLRLWASILQAPYASKLRRAELEELLRPVLMALSRRLDRT